MKSLKLLKLITHGVEGLLYSNKYTPIGLSPFKLQIWHIVNRRVRNTPKGGLRRLDNTKQSRLHNCIYSITDKQTDRITPISMTFIYLPVKFEFDWTKHLQVRV